MQNKGLVILFAILFGLVSIYQLSFSFGNSSIESDAEQFAASKIDASVEDFKNKRKALEVNYLDSLASSKESVFMGSTYAEVKENSMKLGLDLKGGLEAILQVSVKDILKGLANNSKDPVFNKALEDADELQKNSQNDYIEDFYTSFDAIKGDKKLSSPDIFATRSLEDEIRMDSSEEDVKRVITRKIDESINSALQVLRTRIDQFGVASPNIQRLGTSGRILVELPGVKDVERAKALITGTAQLEFWFAMKADGLYQYMSDVNAFLKNEQEAAVTATDSTAVEADEAEEADDLIGDLTGETDETTTVVNPFLDLVKGPGYQGGPILGMFNITDKQKVLDILNRREIKSLLPANAKEAKFVFGKPEKDSELIALYALQGNRDNVPPLSGSIDDARQDYNLANQVVVSMQMDAKGSRIWEEMTTKAYKEGSQIAIVLDNLVYSAPGINNGPIAGGSSQISGDFTVNEAIDLANVLRAGKLPAKATIIQSDEVGPTLGQEAIDSGTMSFGIALALVLIWMFFYYGKAGLFADIAMLLNILLIFGVLSGIGAVLTLPGIAGIVLTIGMSVDANVLIFERIREELAKGKDQKSAIKDGFSNALSSILDANITTGLTALILFVFGTGPIKGFATTLLIGIGTSLFTAIFITRLLVDWYANKGGKLDFSTGITKNLFRNINIAFLKKRKTAYIISAVLIVGSLASLFTNGLDEGVDFVGGRTYQVRFDQPVSASEITATLSDAAVFGSADAKTFGEDNQLKITTKHRIDEATEEADEEMRQTLFNALQPHLNGMDYAAFISNAEGKTAGLMKKYKVSPTIADDIKKASFWAVLGSLIVVFLYILFRFKRWQFSLGAVAAVFHDVLIVLGVFSLTYKFMPFSMEIDQAFIAAILTVIGYSLNDTVVVFDRIREFFNEHTDWDFDRVIDKSLSSTLSRTLNTSLTTLVVLLAIFIFGGESIRGFMFALIVGVIVGTYSSLFIATPIMYDSVKKGDATDALRNKVQEEELDEAKA
ncbi:protein translocase subunit SecDF [Lacinutrix sp. 5H-3-7-4]|uniref:protein translocase subunit SecDF n=1 Tax=Lacinutrix sp. (strain 5H-3-7-4) TaxID=983544 RepID=UPI00020A358A|nr:protein translocase subunit SecDF [Lacinutrix sp. 5H-3-7-4]AEH00208.1 protein-export membrane protein SecD [Lacinutrix sp. 5H-3-7-4]